MKWSVCLIALVALVASTASAQSPAAPAGAILVTPDQLKWMDGPPYLPAGLKVAVLEGNMSQAGPYTVRLMFPANSKVAAHFHPNDEHVTVISGTFYAGLGTKLSE